MLRRSLQQATMLRCFRRASPPSLLAHALLSPAAIATGGAVASAPASLSVASPAIAAAARASFSSTAHTPRHIRRFTPAISVTSASTNSIERSNQPAERSSMLFAARAPGAAGLQHRRSKHSKAQSAAASSNAAAAASPAAASTQQPASPSTPVAAAAAAPAVDSAARPVSGHNVPSFLRPSSSAAAPTVTTAATAAAPPSEAAPISSEAPTSNTAATAPATAASPAVSAAAASAPAASSPAVDPATSAAGSSGAAAPHTSVPTFLRPAPAAPIPMLLRLQRHRWYKYWPNIGYLISVTGLLVTDILWLRSIIIVANIFGIAVHYSFSPPFWTGIYWSCFFILANLVHIGLILYDRRAVHLSDEEQAVYDATFASVFSPQEFRKLLSQGEWHDLAPGSPLMQQGEEIEAVHWVSAGVCVVEQEKLTPLSAEEAEARARRAAAAGSGEKPARIQQRRINGQSMLVSILDPPSPGSALAAASSSSASSSSAAQLPSGVSGVSLPADGAAPPSIGKSLLQSVLQGGLSWMDRVRVVPGPGRSGRGAPENADLPSASLVPTEPHSDVHHQSLHPHAHHPPAHADTTEVSQAPAPLPSSHIHLHLPTHAHDAPSATANAAVPATAASSAAAPATVVDHPSLPEAIILPSASSSSLQQPHAAPHAHHLLNVHVDSTDANSPKASAAKAEADDDSAADSSASAPRAREREREREREALPISSGMGDGFGFDVLHESDRKSSAASSSIGSSSSGSALGDDDDDDAALSSDLIDEDHLDPMDKQEQLQLTRRALEAASGAQPLDGRITHEHVLARWRSDREAHRAARMREKEARVAQRAAVAEQKRLRGLSALERQFGQAATAAPASDKKRGATQQDASMDAAAASAASVAASSSGALVPSAASSSSALSPASSAVVPASGSLSASAASPALPLPAFERHSQVLGYVRAGRLIGEMCLVSPSSATGAEAGMPDATAGAANSYAIAPVSVTTAAPTRVLSWDRRALQRLFFVLPSLAVGWYSVVSTDLVNRLHAQRASSAAEKYSHLMTGVLSDGTVSERQRALLASYRAQHEIPPEMHARALQSLGWSAQDFERGSQQRGWMEAWLGSSKASSSGGAGPASSSA